MDTSRVGYRRCTCSYKCKHSTSGFQIVSRRTYFDHLNQDSRGNIHPSVQRRTIGDETLRNSSLEQNMEVEELPPTNRSSLRRAWCTCHAYCSGGREVAPSTYVRHKKLFEKYGTMLSHLGFPSSNHIVVGSDNHLLNEVDPNLDEHNLGFTQDGNVFEGILFENEQVEDVSIGDKIYERLFELQAMWDKYQVPIKF